MTPWTFFLYWVAGSAGLVVLVLALTLAAVLLLVLRGWLNEPPTQPSAQKNRPGSVADVAERYDRAHPQPSSPTEPDIVMRTTITGQPPEDVVASVPELRVPVMRTP